jgi:hypothetical protein
MEALIDLLLRVVDSPPCSTQAADELEMELRHQPDVTAVEEFLFSLALFEPTDDPGPHLVGSEALRSSARDALHDLGSHDRCLHDVPLMDRP